MTTQPTKNPYTFSKDAWHCKLFKWCYGVNPPDVFKTMCPYFWSFVGTLFIIPFIAIAKAMKIPSKSIGEFVSNRVKDCENYKQKRKDKKRVKAEAKRQANLNEGYLIVKAIMENPDATDEEILKAYNLLKANQVRTGSLRWFMENDLQLMNYYDVRVYIWQFELRVEKARANIKEKEEELAAQKRNYQIEKVDNIIEKLQESKILKWILMIIAEAAIVCIIGALLYGLYELFAGIIIPHLTVVLGSIALGVLIIVLFVGTVFSIYQFFKCWGETIVNGLAWFFNTLENGFVHLLGYCKPLLNIFLIFKYIALGFVLIGKTIYAIYKQYCPIITWVEK